MKTTYVTLKQGEALKKLKFEPNIAEGNNKAFGKKSPYNKLGDEVNWTTGHFYCWKPTLDYACKWLRENFDVHVSAHPSYNRYGVIYMCTVFFIHKDRVYNNLLKDERITIDFEPPQIFETHELALSAGFDYAIKEIYKHKIKIISDKEKEETLKKIDKLKKDEKKRLDKMLGNLKILKNVKQKLFKQINSNKKN
ncbi:MAG TPA: hypothetical protein VN026_02855 [Bacteroidia bacterium]|jgi:hypothetical protein|nr:hypothetical protein [Bacteroidia bacterium]